MSWAWGVVPIIIRSEEKEKEQKIFPAAILSHQPGRS
jgi:hypothetical protein